MTQIMDFTGIFDSQAIDYEDDEDDGIIAGDITSAFGSTYVDYDDLEQEERVAKHVAYCGRYLWTVDPHTGKAFSKHLTCGYWRRCSKCYTSRVEAFQARADRCQLDAGSWLRCIITTVRKAKRITKKLTRDNYWRIPQSDSLVILIYDSFNFPQFQNLEQVDIDDLDWEAVARTPERTKYTGNLGREPEEEPLPHISVSIPHLEITGLDNGKIRAAFNMAMEDTSSFHPRYDVDEIQFCSWLVLEKVKEHVKKLGGKATESTRRHIRVYEHKWRGWQAISKNSSKRDNVIPPGGIDDAGDDDDHPFGTENEPNIEAITAELYDL